MLQFSQMLCKRAFLFEYKETIAIVYIQSEAKYRSKLIIFAINLNVAL